MTAGTPKLLAGLFVDHIGAFLRHFSFSHRCDVSRN
jgi:hypothetical protein